MYKTTEEVAHLMEEIARLRLLMTHLNKRIMMLSRKNEHQNHALEEAFEFIGEESDEVKRIKDKWF